MLVLQLTRHDALPKSPAQSTYGLLVLDDAQEDNFFVQFPAPTDLLDPSHVPVSIERIGAWICEAVEEASFEGKEGPAQSLSEALEYGDKIVLRLAPEPVSGLQGADVDWEHIGSMEEHADMKEMFESEWRLAQALPIVASSPTRPKF